MQNEVGPLQDQFTVTPEDYEAGCKTVPFEMKNGTVQQVKLTAPPWRKGAELMRNVLVKGDPWVFLEATLPPELVASNWLNKVSPLCLPQLLGVAWALVGGLEFQKSLTDAGSIWMERLVLQKPDSQASAAPSQPL